ncbi:hypothetical protein BV22DRAFT_724492 [Leucogyrophana mollusca]|uniref:Uncharacterized protein n=1 Tax=Leucogyrophana mollusca TaxID=85980 RepID=A0ACB8B9T3_9AGAM|nr:hypothetical protein BV22DRAFT_724492 [Leucogyrophana mollusca]
MFSKEKRQLKNKIFARNLRVRRKVYITTLGGNVAECDHLISAMRTELGSSQSQSETSPSARRSTTSSTVSMAAAWRFLTPRRCPRSLPPCPPLPPRRQIQLARRRRHHRTIPTKTSSRLGSRAPFLCGLGSGITRVHDTRPAPRGPSREGDCTWRWRCELDDLEGPRHQPSAGEPGGEGEVGVAGEYQP